MTERELRELFAAWQQRLGLARWLIDVRIASCDHPAWSMQVTRSSNYERAVILVQPWVLAGDPPADVIEREMTPEVIERTVVHELLHCHTRDIRSVVDDLDGMLHPDAHQLACAAAKRAEEVAVDRLAVALVAAWPQ